jgi:sulfate permease, SulP family
MELLRKWIPALDWLKNYRRDDLSGDISAGLTVGVMLIPQGMAYSMLAGLPPIYGLYAATLPLIVYALMGTSRQLAVGPVAMVSLLIASGVGQLAATGSSEFIAFAILLALMVGVIQLLMGVFRIGFLVNFLSHPVIAGFTSAAAVIIGFSQLKHVLGVKTDGESVYKIIMQISGQLGNINYITVTVGVLSILVLIGFKKIKTKIPAPLVVVVLGILAAKFLNLNGLGVSILKEVPAGLPAFALPELNLNALKQLLPTAMAISFVGFMESIAVAKAMQAKHKNYEVNADQELKALGMANIVGSFFKAFPVTGGFSRTAVNNQAGARTGLSSIISAVLLLLTLLFLTSLFYFLPHAVLAAIILVAVYGLIDFKEAKHLWHTDKTDFWLFMAAVAGTLVLGIEEGILLGVALSMGMLIYRVSYPHYAQLGQLPGTREFRNVKRYQDAVINDKVVVMRFDAQLYFANLSYFKDKVKTLLKSRKNPQYFILDAGQLNNLDSSAVHALHDLVEELKSLGVTFFLANMIGPVRDTLFRSGLVKQIGADHFFLTVADAWDAALEGRMNIKKEEQEIVLQNNIESVTKWD